DLRILQGGRGSLPPASEGHPAAAETGDRFRVSPARFEAKILAPKELGRSLAMIKRPLVFTNGVFDILHRGHVTYLARARGLGAALLVALNSDASVRKLGKGADRPLNALADRLAVLAALECVDAVTWFEDDTPEALIAACRP